MLYKQLSKILIHLLKKKLFELGRRQVRQKTARLLKQVFELDLNIQIFYFIFSFSLSLYLITKITS